MDEIFSIIGKIITYGGGPVVIAYLVFQYLGQKWIETKFSERLEAFKSAQERELECYRQQVSILLSRVTKIHEKEIEVLPKIWKRLQEALGYVSKITSPLQFSPDFKKMSDEQFSEFLKNKKLKDSDIEDLINTPVRDRNNKYWEVIFWYDLHEVKKRVYNFHNYYISNRIFLSQDLKKEFQKIDELLLSAINDREISELAKGSGGSWDLVHKGYKDISKESGKIVARIEELVQKRLEFDKATPMIDISK